MCVRVCSLFFIKYHRQIIADTIIVTENAINLCVCKRFSKNEMRKKKITTNAHVEWVVNCYPCSKHFMPQKEINIKCDCPHIRISPKLEKRSRSLYVAYKLPPPLSARFLSPHLRLIYFSAQCLYKIGGNHNYHVWGIELNAINVINMICSVHRSFAFVAILAYICHMWSRSKSNHLRNFTSAKHSNLWMNAHLKRSTTSTA